MYTDTSKTEDKLGIVIIYDKEVFTYKVTSPSSIFLAKAFAILKALQLALRKESRDFTIHIDLLSILTILKNTYNLSDGLKDYKTLLLNTMTRETP